ncbi:type II secretion system F family protein [Micromonospora sp. NPDC002575]|uniref:type II secretion system F family protein n=1 Tax=Micromonospora sp. NPDC002575 TaxID=3364222 RepID=UPI0036955A59
MTTAGWLVAVCLVAAAATVVWPLRNGRARRRSVLGALSPASQHPPGDRGVDERAARVPDPPDPGGAPGPARRQAEAGQLTGHTHPPGWPTPASRCTGPATAPSGWPGPATPPSGGRRPGPPGRRDPRRPAGTPDRPPTAGHRPGPPPGQLGSRPSGTSVDTYQRAYDPSASSASGTRSLRLPEWLSASPRRALLVAGAVGAGSGGLLAGPVAAVVVGAYGSLLVRGLARRQRVRLEERARRHGLDQLCALAAELRAGVPVLTVSAALTPGGRSVLAPDAGQSVPSGAPASPGGAPHGAAPGAHGQSGLPAAPPDGADRLRQLARAAVRLADRTGAPLADLLERIEADARAGDRGLAAAAAQAAGARATAWLLAALPLGGIGLGYGVGVDPVAVLLHTPVGGGCAVAAVVLQLAGLLWTERLGAAPGGSPR